MVSNEQGVSAEQGVRGLYRTRGPAEPHIRGSQMNKGSKLNKGFRVSIEPGVPAGQESGDSNEQRVSVEQRFRGLKYTRGLS